MLWMVAERTGLQCPEDWFSRTLGERCDRKVVRQRGALLVLLHLAQVVVSQLIR